MAVRVNEAAVRLGDVYINAHVGTLRKLGIADDEPMSPLARVNVLVPAFPQLKPKSLSANYGLALPQPRRLFSQMRNAIPMQIH